MKPIQIEWVRNHVTGDDKWELKKVEPNKIEEEKQGVIFPFKLHGEDSQGLMYSGINLSYGNLRENIRKTKNMIQFPGHMDFVAWGEIPYISQLPENQREKMFERFFVSLNQLGGARCSEDILRYAPPLHVNLPQLNVGHFVAM